MTSRFEPDFVTPASPVFHSEEQAAVAAAPRFEVEEETSRIGLPAAQPPITPPTADAEDHLPEQTELLEPDDGTEWRREVAARVSHFRARKRTRGPRYPSLTLRFEPSETRASEISVAETAASVPPNRAAIAFDPRPEAGTPPASPPPAALAETAKIIEFPRSITLPAPPLDELADPILERPRILEAPEILPPPPALGGMTIEAEQAEQPKRPGFELPLQPPPLFTRTMAGVADFLVISGSFSAFTYVFYRVAGMLPSPQQGFPYSAGLIAIFWAAYNYVMLVYTGSTVGLKLARLEVCRFDGTPAPRRIRHWRACASLLSGVSLGLGYLWCFLDEDRLCWHDRITTTYMARKARSKEAKPGHTTGT